MMWCGTPEVQNNSSWSSAGRQGPPFFSTPLPARMWILPPPPPLPRHHQEQNLIPGQMCCSGAHAWDPISVFWGAVLHHSTVSGELGVVAVLSEAQPSSAEL